MKKIKTIAKKLSIPQKAIITYGDYKAKINPAFINLNNNDSSLVLVTAMTPTKFGEGKTTMSIALTDGLNSIGQKSLLCLREPSLGPVFGLKGGATGGGKASIVPGEDINMHFNGDMHALTSSINLISAVIDNELFRENKLNIDPNKVVWKRALDMNDRALRNIIVGADNINGVKREDGFVITVASELMAIMCIADSEEDFLNRISKIIVAYNTKNEPIYLEDLKITHAVMKLMKEALKPNLVQTLEGNPVIVHGGPFANIAHGCSSLIATKTALSLAPIVITEAGFGADLGAEKFFDIKCRFGNLDPKATVFVITLRAILEHGGYKKDTNNIKEAVIVGFNNAKQHIENLNKFNLPVLMVLNQFPTDLNKEFKPAFDELKQLIVKEKANNQLLDFAVSNSFSKGSKGGIDIANGLLRTLEKTTGKYQTIYELSDSISVKIEKIAKSIYRADGVDFSQKALEQIKVIESLKRSDLAVCIAKTPLSFSDNPQLINVARNFRISVKQVSISSGAGFVVVETGDVLKMPGLPLVPAAVKMEDNPY